MAPSPGSPRPEVGGIRIRPGLGRGGRRVRLAKPRGWACLSNAQRKVVERWHEVRRAREARLGPGQDDRKAWATAWR